MVNPSNGSSLDNRWKHVKFTIGILFLAFIVAIGALVKAQMDNDKSFKKLNEFRILQEKVPSPPPPQRAIKIKDRIKQAEIFTQEFPDGLTITGLKKDDWISGKPGSQVPISYNGEIRNNGNRPIDVDLLFKVKCDQADGRIDFSPGYQIKGRVAKVKENDNSDLFIRYPGQGLHLKGGTLLPGEIMQAVPAIGLNGLSNQVDKNSPKVDYMLILNGSANLAFTIPQNARPGSDYTIRYSIIRNDKEYLFPHCTRIYVDKEAKPMKK